MAFHTRDYETYAFLGDPSFVPLWHWSAWRKLIPELDPLVQRARGKASIRSTQYFSNSSGRVKFGRIGWRDADHQKWTHCSPISAHESADWRFLAAELWAPAWTQCEREDLAPDVFLSLRSDSINSKPMSFDPVVILAVANELAQREATQVGALVSRLSELLAAKLIARSRRPWGGPVGIAGFTDSIQDLHLSGLFKPGDRHKRPVDLATLDGSWDLVNVPPTLPS